MTLEDVAACVMAIYTCGCFEDKALSLSLSAREEETSFRVSVAGASFFSFSVFWGVTSRGLLGGGYISLYLFHTESFGMFSTVELYYKGEDSLVIGDGSF